MNNIRVLVWNEYLHERESKEIGELYPNGIHGAIADSLKQTGGFEVSTAVMDDFEHGLTEERLKETDVLVWWGHQKHADVSDAAVERVYRRVQEGMGLILLHSAHASKIFIKLCGCNTQNLKWRDIGEKEILWAIDLSHPIVQGLTNDHIILEHEETYGERFDIPEPDDLIFISWFSGGEVFRSGVTYKRGLGKIFYFRPGHETYPTYYNPDIMKVISNAARWCAPQNPLTPVYGWRPEPLV